MILSQIWKRPVWVLAAMLAGGVIGGILTFAHVGAAPLDTTGNVSQGTGVFAARYIEDTVAAYIVRSHNDDAESEPILLMTGRMKVQFRQSEGNDKGEQDFFGFMYVNEKDLKAFPGAMVMANREDDIICHPIDTVNTDQGLVTLRQAFEEAYGPPPVVE